MSMLHAMLLTSYLKLQNQYRMGKNTGKQTAAVPGIDKTIAWLQMLRVGMQNCNIACENVPW